MSDCPKSRLSHSFGAPKIDFLDCDLRAKKSKPRLVP
jgi:hypothetical protein